MGRVTFHFLRHLPPAPSEAKIVYGRGAITLDTTSAPVQARLQHLADLLPHDHNTDVIVSPTPRTWLTWSLISKKNPALAALPAVPGPAFVEQDWGQFTGLHQSVFKTQHELAQAWSAYVADPLHCKTPDGECYKDLCARVAKGMTDAAAERMHFHEDRHVVIVAHAGTLRAALAFALALPDASMLGGTMFTPLAHLVLTAHEQRDHTTWQLSGLSQGVSHKPAPV